MQMVNELQDPHSTLSQQWDREHNEFVVQAMLARIEHEFKPSTWQAFHRLALQQQSVDQVAASLDISPNAAFIARSRVLKRLREVAGDLLE